MDDTTRPETSDEPRGGYRQALLGLREDVVAGEGFLYRPGEILVAGEDYALVEEELGRAGAALPESVGLGIVRLRAPSGVIIAELVPSLRRPRAGKVARVGPNHVLIGEPKLHGGPASFAWPAVAPPPVPGKAGVGLGVVIAVLDTGIVLRDGVVDHAFLVANCSAADPVVDAEEMDRNPSDGNLDDEAGHGTFIAGIIRQVAPGATIVAAQVLESDGVGDELAVAGRILDVAGRHSPAIVNLSLGGYTQDDAPPVALAAAIDALPPEVVLVAAAGNDGLDRPFWPAAFPRVVSVGALECSMGHSAPHQRMEGCELLGAAYSNRGSWVRTSAIGDWTSSFFTVDDPALALPDGTEVPARSFAGWARWTGTSFAAPAVSGAIAARMTKRKIGASQAAAELIDGAGVPKLAALGAVVDVVE